MDEVDRGRKIGSCRLAEALLLTGESGSWCWRGLGLARRRVHAGASGHIVTSISWHAH